MSSVQDALSFHSAGWLRMGFSQWSMITPKLIISQQGFSSTMLNPIKVDIWILDLI
jgi:hypothetical protein